MVTGVVCGEGWEQQAMAVSAVLKQSTRFTTLFSFRASASTTTLLPQARDKNSDGSTTFWVNVKLKNVCEVVFKMPWRILFFLHLYLHRYILHFDVASGTIGLGTVLSPNLQFRG